ncbi:MAG: ATP-binding protein [Nitrososphaerota archaeon]|nr:ATP-binding protein [Nitrososphaerota archaeon]
MSSTHFDYLSGNLTQFLLELTVQLNLDELDALKTLLLCSVKLEEWRKQLPRTEQNLSKISEQEATRKILNEYGKRLFEDIGTSITIVLHGEGVTNAPVTTGFRISWGNRTFHFCDATWLSKDLFSSARMHAWQSPAFGDIITKAVKQNYVFLPDPNAEISVGQRRPSMSELVFEELSNDDFNSVARISFPALVFQEYERQFGYDSDLSEILNLIVRRGFRGSGVTIHDYIATIFSGAISLVRDLRGKPERLTPLGQVDTTGNENAQPKSASGSGEIVIPSISKLQLSDLANALFELETSRYILDQERFLRICEQFKKFTGGLTCHVFVEEMTFEGKASHSLENVSPNTLGVSSINPFENEKFLAVKESRTPRVVKGVGIQISDGTRTWPLEFTSSGTIELLYLITSAIGMRNSIQLLDEPAQNMHPIYQRKMLELIISSVQEYGNQVILITHSPYLIDINSFKGVWRFDKDQNGTSVFCLWKILDGIDSSSKQKAWQELNNVDIRSLIFSRGVVYVEGLTDKVVLEGLENKLEAQGRGAGLGKYQWEFTSMNGKDHLPTLVKFAKSVKLAYAALLDLNGLSHAKKLVSEIKNIKLDAVTSDHIREEAIYILPKDMDEILGLSKKGKPIQALDILTSGTLHPENYPELLDFFNYLRSVIPPSG